MPRIFCIDCAIPVVVDPQGRCPEGHVLDGSSPDAARDEEVAAADSGPGEHSGLDLFDELRDLDSAGLDTASDAASTAAAPADTSPPSSEPADTGSSEARTDELEAERGAPRDTPSEGNPSGDDLAFLFEPAASTSHADTPPAVDDDSAERTQPIAISSATGHGGTPVPSPASSTRIDPMNFTSRGGRVGDVHAAAGGWRSRFARRRVS